MENRWNTDEASKFEDDPLGMRVYTSRLLGQEPNLVLHGGGNTSLKVTEKDFFGEMIDVLYVKGSGWDLASIEKEGFSPVRMEVLLKLAEFDELSDGDMMRQQRTALTDPFAPNPSVEAILHAIIPFKFVDHTHADAVIAIMNTPKGEQHIKDLYGDSVLIVPYVMPGFKLARRVYEMTRDIDWEKLSGIILMNHGVFTFSDDARESYEMMIELVNKAEQYLNSYERKRSVGETEKPDLVLLARTRKAVSIAADRPMLARLDASDDAIAYTYHPDIDKIAFQGPLTPDHIIRTKRTPMPMTDDPAADVLRYTTDYRDYFDLNTRSGLRMIDPAPRWAVWRKRGLVSFGESSQTLRIVSDIIAHTIDAQQWSAAMGGWKSLPERDLFDMEYWELEQAKLERSTKPPPLQGKVAVVTGAASGIGAACMQCFAEQGAVVVGLDMDESVVGMWSDIGQLGLQMDVTDVEAVTYALGQAVQNFGGIDILVSNAGFFPQNETLGELDDERWQQSVDVNLTGHRNVLKHAIPYLRHGIDPTVIVMGSKNYGAPGRGAAAYSVMKAGVTQLARIAAIELAEDGIRVNVVHPDAVFDTGIWTDEMLTDRARYYSMTVEEYKAKNLLKTEITSHDVARLVAVMAGETFSKTTGAQIPIDGGNERII